MIQSTYIYLLQGYIVEDLKNKMKYLRNAKPKAMKREGENMEDPKPKKKRAEPKQFPHNPTEVPEMPVGEDLSLVKETLKILCSIRLPFGGKKLSIRQQPSSTF